MDGTKFYAEQTSHHPPMTNFMCVGPNECYKFQGYFEYKAWLSGLNSIGGARVGKQTVNFADGSIVTIKDPNIDIAGLAFGDRVNHIVGQLIITDHTNKLEAVVTYNPPTKSGGYFKSIKKKLFKSSKEQPTDAILIQIMQKANNNDKEQVVVCEGSGSWLEYIEFEGKPFWSVDDDYDQWYLVNDRSLPEQLHEHLLESDSCFRKDMLHLKNQDYDAAEIEKRALEDL